MKMCSSRFTFPPRLRLAPPRPPRHTIPHGLQPIVDRSPLGHSPTCCALRSIQSSSRDGCIQAGARDMVAAFSERFDIPVTTSLKAKGVVAEGASRREFYADCPCGGFGCGGEPSRRGGRSLRQASGSWCASVRAGSSAIA